ncbi:predicted protein [Naegleria gruberi]|uniref:Predicted protein n=1 Tax=Naegleria gruberi TaxID=5762 RepID=D2VF64_NAEGR|nr:uncharacterized protein NAEGRDRAFT_67515 [Naegleria gruberi]EFC44629.1 predicted protein [Naegleria gruberi]|eukprot:XP_002677373.1 predicted protein [Naegleria gruberi strain NEG-M]
MPNNITATSHKSSPVHHSLTLQLVSITKDPDTNFILGHSHFIKTVEDLHETIFSTNPNIKFGIAFCEASGKCLIRTSGNDQKLIEMAILNANLLRAGHTFIIMIENGFPVNILNSIKNVPEVCRIYCATANPTQVIVCQTEQGRGLMGVIDGSESKGVETEDDVKDRKELLRNIGYKL